MKVEKNYQNNKKNKEICFIILVFSVKKIGKNLCYMVNDKIIVMKKAKT